MIVLSRKVKRIILVAILLLLLCLGLRFATGYLKAGILRNSLVMTYTLMEMFLLLGWCYSIQYRILNTYILRYLMSIGGLMVLCILTRTIKYYFVWEEGTLHRFLWYLYYIPLILIPLMAAFLTADIETGRTSKDLLKKNLMWLIAWMLILLVLTNDLHQKVFSFPEGIQNYNDTYNHEMIFFVIEAWIFLLSFFFIIHEIIEKGEAPGSRMLKIIPVAVLFCAIAFSVLYRTASLHVDFVVVDCIFIILIIETMIQSGVIGSNSNYDGLFRISSIAGRIVDMNYEEKYVSSTAGKISRDVMKEAEKGPVLLGNRFLYNSSIRGGHMLWEEDVTELMVQLEHLREIQERLGENNELLIAENALKAKQAQVEEQSEIYDRMSAIIAPKLMTMESMIEECERNPEQAKKILAELCVIGAYVKRRGNLILLSEENKNFSIKELEYSISESLSNLQLVVDEVSYAATVDGDESAELQGKIYDVFETVMENSMGLLRSISVALESSKERIALRMYMNPRGNCEIKLREMLKNISSDASVSLEGETVILMNHRMNELAVLLTGEGLQNADDFWQWILYRASLENEIPSSDNETELQLSDGAVWKFDRKLLYDGFRNIWQMEAVNTTELHQNARELKKDNEELERINRRLLDYSKGIDELTRSRERLETKERFHREFGQALLSAKYWIMSDEEDCSVILEQWKRNLLVLQTKDTEEKTDPFQQLRSDAKMAGVTVEITGSIPTEKERQHLLYKAAAEALTNAVKHGNADFLRMDIVQKGGFLEVCFTNNGTVPEGSVAEGGGLGVLRCKVEQTGGTMEIYTQPQFCLKIRLREVSDHI